MKTYAFRLKPGMDLRGEIDSFVSQKNIKAGCIASCVGNLTKVILRMAGAEKIKEYNGKFEIVSLVGTLESGNSHLHLSASDGDGNVFGGHLKNGSIVGVTAEVVITDLDDLSFKRVYDEATKYEELVVEENRL